MKKKLLPMLLAALMLTMTACGSNAAPSQSGDDSSSSAGNEENSNNQVIIAMESDIVTLDPGYCYEMYPPMILNACYETLYKFEKDGEPAQPSLAESCDFTEDGLTATIKLKQNVTFASGNKMTSKDVVFSINRCKNLQGNPAFICDTIDSMEAPDDYTVVFHLTQPDSAFISKLTYVSLSVLDSEVVKENGGTDAEDAATADKAQTYLDSTSAGTAPYIMESYTPDVEIVLVRNEKYWGTAPAVDKYIIKEMPDSNTQMMTLQSGDIDIALNLSTDTSEQLTGADGIDLLSASTKTMGFVLMNMDEAIGGPVANPTVQKAIRKAIDYAGIQTLVGEGSVTPTSFIQVGFMGAVEPRSTDYTNIEDAKKLMADAGYENGFEIDFKVCTLSPEGIPLPDIAQKLKEDLSKIGITMNIQTVDWAGGYGDEYREGTLGFTVMYWGPDYNDPNVQLPFLPGQAVGLRANWQESANPELAALNNAATAALDDASRTEILKQIQEMTADDSPFIPIVQYPKHIGVKSGLKGVVYSDVYRLDLTKLSW